jgi:hypothetical protein
MPLGLTEEPVQRPKLNFMSSHWLPVFYMAPQCPRISGSLMIAPKMLTFQVGQELIARTDTWRPGIELSKGVGILCCEGTKNPRSDQAYTVILVEHLSRVVTCAMAPVRAVSVSECLKADVAKCVCNPTMWRGTVPILTDSINPNNQPNPSIQPTHLIQYCNSIWQGCARVYCHSKPDAVLVCFEGQWPPSKYLSGGIRSSGTNVQRTPSAHPPRWNTYYAAPGSALDLS